MKCCWFFFFFMCVVTFVQIRLRQQRDVLNFPKKFAVNYKIEGTKLRKHESSRMVIKQERMLYGSPPITISNNSFVSHRGIHVNCYLSVTGPATTFHTFSLKTEGETLKSVTVLTNTAGLANTFLNHHFFYLDPNFFMTHTYDDHISQAGEGDATSFGIVEITNLPIVLNKPLGFDYVKL